MNSNFKKINTIFLLAASCYVGMAQAASIGFDPILASLDNGASGSLGLNIDFSGVNDESIGATLMHE